MKMVGLRVLTLLLILLGFSLTVYAAKPTVSVSLYCRTDAKLEVTVSATDPDKDLVNIRAYTFRFADEGDCYDKENCENDALIIDYTFSPRSSASKTETVSCIKGKYYFARGIAVDAKDNYDDKDTACCECREVTVVKAPALTQGGLVGLGALLAGMLAWRIRRRLAHRPAGA